VGSGGIPGGPGSIPAKRVAAGASGRGGTRPSRVGGRPRGRGFWRHSWRAGFQPGHVGCGWRVGSRWNSTFPGGRGAWGSCGVSAAVGYAEGDVHHGYVTGFGLQVRALVVKEHVRLEYAEYPILPHAAEKEHLVGIHPPMLQGGDDPLM